RIFSVRQGKTGLDVQEEYDPTIRPWYLSAVARKGPVWTKYPDWDLLGTGGKLVFAIGKDFDGQITDKVSPGLAAAFRSRQVSLGVNSPISMEQAGRWIIQDEKGNNYEIRKENDELNVYRIDVLTCSQAVSDSEGRLAGVVGLDISMEVVGTKVIRTPESFRGYAFLLNGMGDLVDQEKIDMFIPKARGEIRKKWSLVILALRTTPTAPTMWPSPLSALFTRTMENRPGVLAYQCLNGRLPSLPTIYTRNWSRCWKWSWASSPLWSPWSSSPPRGCRKGSPDPSWRLTPA